MMKQKSKTDAVKNQYVFCDQQKGRPRKHIDVCFVCRRRKKCKTFQDFIQNGLPFDKS